MTKQNRLRVIKLESSDTSIGPYNVDYRWDNPDITRRFYCSTDTSAAVTLLVSPMPQVTALGEHPLTIIGDTSVGEHTTFWVTAAVFAAGAGASTATFVGHVGSWKLEKTSGTSAEASFYWVD